MSTQRQRFRDALVRAAYAQYTRGDLLGTDESEWGAELLARPENRKAVDGCWRTVNAVGIVRSLLTQKAALARAAEGILDADEQARVLRRRAEADAWTAADLPLIDEAEAFVKGGPRRFGHVVVDEAQDLSPMQLRMLAATRTRPVDDGARRSRAGHRPRVAALLGRDARAPRPAGARRVRGAHDRLPAAGCDPRPRQPIAAVRRGRRRAVAVGARDRRPSRLPRDSRPTSSRTRSPSTRSRSPRRWRRSP